MSNRTYVCLDCRTAKRADAAYGAVTDYRCTQCQKSLVELPWRRRIPKRDDDREWDKLAALVAELEQERLPRLHARGMIEIAKIDQKIAALEAQNKAKGKVERLRYLRFRRRQVQRAYDF